MRRWRLVLGGADDGTGTSLGGDDARIDAALSALYDSDADQSSSSQPAGSAGPGWPRRPRGWPAGSAISGRFSRSAWSR
jgi:hypothetical protein